MQVAIIRTSTLALGLLFSSMVLADKAVAILNLEFVEDTGDTAAIMCFGEDDTDCARWATYYLFEATALKVISGELPDEPFPVLFGKHALKKQGFYDVVALVELLEDADPGEPKYRIAAWGERLMMYCFRRRNDEDTEIAVELNDKEQLSCHSPERF
ncbi:MAG: hypothetical protein HKN77_00745 [Woeseiaceae bacterium]|nr:hypothetical protein [Woeseiaceae bacterium]